MTPSCFRPIEGVGGCVVIWIGQVRELAGADVESWGPAWSGVNETEACSAAADKGAVWAV